MTAILMYHRVTDIPKALDPLGLAMSPTQFEQQMSYLARKGYVCLTLADAVRYFRQGKKMPARSFVLTFDDGYQDVLLKACPILEKFGFTATVFLVAGRMGSLSNWRGQDEARAGLLLSQAEVRDLSLRGHIIGSHTLSHPSLNSLDELSAFEELRNSKALLQDQLGMQVDFFSYPYSQTSVRIEVLVEAAGYMAACAGNSGPWSIFNMWRVPCLRDDTTLSFAMKVCGLYNQRTALRESTPGRLLRRGVHMFRRGLSASHSSVKSLRGNHD